MRSLVTMRRAEESAAPRSAVQRETREHAPTRHSARTQSRTRTLDARLPLPTIGQLIVCAASPSARVPAVALELCAVFMLLRLPAPFPSTNALHCTCTVLYFCVFLPLRLELYLSSLQLRPLPLPLPLAFIYCSRSSANPRMLSFLLPLLLILVC